MGLEIATTSNEINTPDVTSDGYTVGAASTSLVGFYGATPIARPSGAAQAALSDLSGGAASPTTGLQALTATYNSTLLINAIATLAAQGNAIRNALVSVGIIKGSA